MLNKALEAFGDLGDDEELGPADWPTVRRYIVSLKNVEGEHAHPHNASESHNNLDHINVKDIRIRILNGNFICFFFQPYLLIVSKALILHQYQVFSARLFTCPALVTISL